VTASAAEIRPISHDAFRCAGGARTPVPKAWEILVVLAVLCVSGNPAALRLAGHEVTYAVVALLLAFGVVMIRGGRAALAFAPVASIYAVLSVVQAYDFDFFPLATVLGFFARLFIGMAVIVLVTDFARAYVVAMVGLSMLSGVFWIPEFVALRFGIHFHEIFSTVARLLGPQDSWFWNLGFHTYITMQPGMERNCGMFWEPGAFAGYLIIALALLPAIRHSMTGAQRLTAFCILTLALISTFSTTGYIAYPIVLLLNCDWRKWRRPRASRLFLACLVAPLLITGSVYAFGKLDFLQSKIRLQLRALARRERGWQITRLGTLVFDAEYISKRPLTGWGLHDSTHFALHPWAKRSRFGNGMCDFIVSFGGIGFGTFLIGVARGAYRLGGRSRGYVLGFLGATLIVLQGEPFLGFPLFLGLMFLRHTSFPPRRTSAATVQRIRFGSAASSWVF
jgi:hypothetical protein